jgi:hypothetical protein
MGQRRLLTGDGEEKKLGFGLPTTITGGPMQNNGPEPCTKVDGPK